MARYAHGLHIFEATLAAALGDRDDVIRVPKRAAAHAVRRVAEGFHEPAALFQRAPQEIREQADRVHLAHRAHPLVAREDALPHVDRVGAQSVLVHAGIAAECHAVARALPMAEATEGATVRSLRQEGVDDAPGGGRGAPVECRHRV